MTPASIYMLLGAGILLVSEVFTLWIIGFFNRYIGYRRGP